MLEQWEREKLFNLLRHEITNHWYLIDADELEVIINKLEKVLLPVDSAIVQKMVHDYSEDMGGPNMTVIQKETLVNLILTLKQ